MRTPYSLIMLAAIATATLLLRRSQQALPLNRWQRLAVGLGAFCGAMIGAKLPYVFSDWEAFRSGWAWFSDGKTILLGFAGGYAGVEVAKWSLEIRTRTGDTFAVPVAVAVAIGRLGCFVGECCYGQPTDLPWGVVFPSVDRLARHPTQLYESAFHLLCAALLALARTRGWFRENLFKIYIATYAVYRFGSEYLRPEAPLWAGLTGYQWASLALAVTFGWLAARHPSPTPPPTVRSTTTGPSSNAGHCA